MLLKLSYLKQKDQSYNLKFKWVQSYVSQKKQHITVLQLTLIHAETFTSRHLQIRQLAYLLSKMRNKAFLWHQNMVCVNYIKIMI